jgi:hypothetical protein
MAKKARTECPEHPIVDRLAWTEREMVLQYGKFPAGIDKERLKYDHEYAKSLGARFMFATDKRIVKE